MPVSFRAKITGIMAAVSAVMMSRRLPRRPKSRMTRNARIDLHTRTRALARVRTCTGTYPRTPTQTHRDTYDDARARSKPGAHRPCHNQARERSSRQGHRDAPVSPPPARPARRGRLKAPPSTAKACAPTLALRRNGRSSEDALLRAIEAYH